MPYIEHGDSVDIVVEKLPLLNRQVVTRWRCRKRYENRDAIVLVQEHTRQEELDPIKEPRKEPQRLFISQDFVVSVDRPVVAIVIAEDMVRARAVFERALLEAGLPTDLYSLKEVSLFENDVRLYGVGS